MPFSVLHHLCFSKQQQNDTLTTASMRLHGVRRWKTVELKADRDTKAGGKMWGDEFLNQIRRP